MHVEGDARKTKAGHVAVEQYLERIRAPYTVFHPLYMYGEHTAKDCEQWFIDRLVRGRPVPIPAPGTETHCRRFCRLPSCVPIISLVHLFEGELLTSVQQCALHRCYVQECTHGITSM
jgi:hypothetical protein